MGDTLDQYQPIAVLFFENHFRTVGNIWAPESVHIAWLDMAEWWPESHGICWGDELSSWLHLQSAPAASPSPSLPACTQLMMELGPIPQHPCCLSPTHVFAWLVRQMHSGEGTVAIFA